MARISVIGMRRTDTLVERLQPIEGLQLQKQHRPGNNWTPLQTDAVRHYSDLHWLSCAASGAQYCCLFTQLA